MAANLEIGNLFEVRGRVIAISGGASGIGLMLARGFVANGASVILIDYNEQALKSAKSELENIITKCSTTNNAVIVTVHGDLSTKEGVQDVLRTIKSTPDLETLDGLIHCAAVRYMNDIMLDQTQKSSLADLEAATLSCPYEGWEHTFRLNVMAPYFLTAGLINLLGAAALKGDGRGSVILFSSPASVHNHQFVPCYQTSKAAVDHLTRILAMEFAQHSIRVNAMSPGLVPSAMTPNDGKSNLHLAAETPAKRAGTEEDMAGCALFLCSKAGAFMDGKVVRIEGGRLLILKGVTSNTDS